MKNRLLILGLFIFLGMSPLHSEKNNNIINFLPRDYSFLIYCHSLGESFKEFKSSYFWSKYKLTQKGKELERTFDSISASTLTIGIILDDLLELFSEQAILSIWLNNKEIQNYLYLIEKKSNRSKINSLITRLQYFAVANKINITVTTNDTFSVYNFNNKVWLCDGKGYVLISNSWNKINGSIEKIKNPMENNTLDDFKTYFKNKNIILYSQQTNVSEKKEYYYSFRFNNKPQIEGLIKENTTWPSNYSVSSRTYNFLPNSINFLCSINKTDIPQYIYPFFDMVSTNIYQFDQDYFDGYLNRIKSYDNYYGICGIDRNKKNTNIIVIIQSNSQNSIQYNLYKQKSEKLSVYSEINGIKIYFDTSYFLFYKEFILFSNNVSFIKKALESYIKKNGFAFTKEFSTLKGLRARDLFLWMDIQEYLTAKALAYGNDKWSYYNAYRKTFRNIHLYGEKKDEFIYINCSF